MKKFSFISFAFAIMLSFFIFFGYLTYSSYPILYFAILIGLILFIKEKKIIKISLNNFLWIFLGIVLVIGSLYSNSQTNSLNFSLSFLLMLSLSIICTNIEDNRWFNYFIKFSIIFGLIHVFGTLLYEISPSFIESICKRILKPGDYIMNIYLMKNGGNPGLTGQTGINGWFISITIGLLFNYLFQDKKKIFKIITLFLVVLSLIALILTSKRSFILFSSLSIIITYFMNSKEKHGKIKRAILILFIGVILYTIISNNSQLVSVFNRFVGDGTDISSGRYSLYKQMIEMFFDNPIFGIGTMSVLPYLGNMGHNIYLQVLCENGILIFILLLIVIINTHKLIETTIKNNDINIRVCSYIFLLFLFYGLTGNPLYTIQEYGILLFAIGYVNHFRYGDERNEKK